MKKCFCALILALALCMGLTAPAFAAKSDWKLEVPGKTDAEVFIGEKTFTVRDWALSSTPYVNEYGEDDYIQTATKTDSRQYTAENLYILSKGDTAVFTKGGESFDYLYMTAWSDPDGDGVYDSRLINFGAQYYGDDGNVVYDFEPILPADASSQRGGYYTASITFGLINWAIFGTGSDRQDEYGSYELGDWNGFPALTVTELKMSPDFLLELYGPNTLVSVTAYGEGGEESDVCTILVEGSTTQPTVPTVPTVGNFTDVKADDYYAEAVEWAVAQGIAGGTGPSTFSPKDDCTTAQILTFLWRAQGEPEPAASNPFSDVKESDYYYKAALWAAEKGLVSGAVFGGNEPCTRAETVTYLWKLAGSPQASAASFDDVPAGADYAQAVAYAVREEITGGTGPSAFSPDQTCTRGQIVTFLYRAYAN